VTGCPCNVDKIGSGETHEKARMSDVGLEAVGNKTHRPRKCAQDFHPLIALAAKDSCTAVLGFRFANCQSEPVPAFRESSCDDYQILRAD